MLPADTQASAAAGTALGVHAAATPRPASTSPSCGAMRHLDRVIHLDNLAGRRGRGSAAMPAAPTSASGAADKDQFSVGMTFARKAWQAGSVTVTDRGRPPMQSTARRTTVGETATATSRLSATARGSTHWRAPAEGRRASPSEHLPCRRPRREKRERFPSDGRAGALMRGKAGKHRPDSRGSGDPGAEERGKAPLQASALLFNTLRPR